MVSVPYFGGMQQPQYNMHGHYRSHPSGSGEYPYGHNHHTQTSYYNQANHQNYQNGDYRTNGDYHENFQSPTRHNYQANGREHFRSPDRSGGQSYNPNNSPPSSQSYFLSPRDFDGELERSFFSQAHFGRFKPTAIPWQLYILRLFFSSNGILSM